LNYRKFYKSVHGAIPVDEHGRTYDIHHVDGDRSNNSIDNLVALSISDHLDVHLKQGDFQAVHAMLMRVEHTSEEISRFASAAQHRRVQEGTHHWQMPAHAERVRQSNITNLEAGTHLFQNPLIRMKTNEANLRRIADGTHPFKNGVGPENSRQRVSEGVHHFQDQIVQTSNSAKTHVKNDIRVQRISVYSKESVLFRSLSEAIVLTPNATRRFIESSVRRELPYLGYRWFILGKGMTAPSNLVPIDDVDLLDMNRYNRLGRKIVIKSTKSTKTWEITFPDGHVEIAQGHRTDVCEQYNLSYSAVKDCKGNTITKGPSKGFRVRIQKDIKL
jgi:hypothetical protein